MKVINSTPKQVRLENEDGSKIIINKWKTTQQISMLPSITKTLGVPFFMVATGAGSEEELMEALPKALYLLCEQMEEEDPTTFFNKLFTNVRFQDQPVDIDQHFDDFDDVLVIAAEVLKLNFGKLLSGKGFTAFRQVAVPLAAQQND